MDGDLAARAASRVCYTSNLALLCRVGLLSPCAHFSRSTERCYSERTAVGKVCRLSDGRRAVVVVGERGTCAPRLAGQYSFEISVVSVRAFTRAYCDSPLALSFLDASYLVDPASSRMLVSKIKPCMSKYKQKIM